MREDNYGWVYLIETTDGTYAKIGSAQTLRRRARQIKLQLPFPVRLAAAFRCADFRRVEKALHADLIDFRLNGEWFKYEMSVIFTAFLEFADRHSSAFNTYFLNDGQWVSIGHYLESTEVC